MKPSVLYISYNGLGEALVSSQVLPYLRGLAAEGYAITLLTYERRGRGPGYDRQQTRARADLDAAGIRWRHLVYHQSPSLLATTFDLLYGWVVAARLVRASGIGVVHTRSYVPGIIGWWAKKWLGVRFVFDMRGLMADEYVDAGNWKRDGLLFRLTKWVEKRLLRAADEVVVLTERVKDYLGSAPDLPAGLRGRITVIPCCVDEHKFRLPEGTAIGAPRQSRAGETLWLVYSGSVGTWYLLEEMLDFFAAGVSCVPGLRLLLLNQQEQDHIRDVMARKGIDAGRVEIVAAAPDEVPGHLCRAGIGLSFIKPTFAKSASSPTKFAEYLATGLPVIVNRGVGDLDAIVLSNRVGVVVEELSPAGYARAWAQIRELMEDPSLPARCRRVAEEQFSTRIGIARYQAVYARLATAQ